MKQYSRILLFFSIGISLACHTTNKPVSNVPSTDKNTSSGFFVRAQYSTYTSAMGKGKGIFFVFEVLTTDSISLPLVVDSIILGGTKLPFQVNQQSPLVIESNYYKLQPEPSVDDPKPTKTVDALIDLHQFYPAQLFVTRNHISYPITIDTIVFIKP